MSEAAATKKPVENATGEKKAVPEAQSSQIDYMQNSSKKMDPIKQVPNATGSIGTIPMEQLGKDSRKLPAREANLKDTSLPSKKETKADEIVDIAFPWKSIGSFSSTGSPSGHAARVKSYILENYYNDFYYNSAIVVGTCFFSWLFARMGFSFWSLGFIFFCTASVYRTEFRRFNRNIRDDLKRIAIFESMGQKPESMLWLNTFLAKFWIIYMPVLSDQVKAAVNPVLEDVTPGYGIEALTLDEFQLGTKAPSIDSITSYTKLGKDKIQMDINFSFTPNDTSDMTQNEIKKKIDPKIALGVTVGKSFVSKSLPILLEDMNVSGKLRVVINFGVNFPNIKLVSVSLLEAPLIDFALKPIGGDTLGLDIMSFIPGLKTMILSIVNANVGPMLYEPNKLDIDVEEIMAAKSEDAIGVIAVTMHGADKLKGSDFIGNTVDPYVIIGCDDEEYRTSTKSDTSSPRWEETQYILVKSMDQDIKFNVYDFNDVRKDFKIGDATFDLKELLATNSCENVTTDVKLSGKSRGTLTYSLNWFPVLEKHKDVEKKAKVTEGEEQDPEKVKKEEAARKAAEDDNVEADSADSGILKITVHQAKKLSTASGVLNPYSELYLDDKLIKTFRTMKRTTEPSWEEATEVLVTSRASSVFKFSVYNSTGSKAKVAEFVGSLDDIMDATAETLPMEPSGEVRVSCVWKPVIISGLPSSVGFKQALGTLRVHLRDANIVGGLEGVGDIDPYVIVSLNKQLKHRTNYYSENTHPNFNQVVYIPIHSENQTLTLDLYDFQNVGKDRSIGTYSVPVSKFLKKVETGYLFHNGSDDVLTGYLKHKGTSTKSYVNYSVTFIPNIPVYTLKELEKVEEHEAQIAEKNKKFEEEQAKMEIEYKKNPKDYEYVDVDVEEEKLAKEKMTLEQLISHNAGTLSLRIVNGKLPKSKTHLQVLVDDDSFASLTTPRSNNKEVVSESGDAFIRDLDHSVICFRITKSMTVRSTDDIIVEKEFKTSDLLKKGYEKPVAIDLSGSIVNVQFQYSPSAIEMPSSETIMDTGLLKLHIRSGDSLPSHDRNGKSDPFVVIKVDGEKVFKTQVVKKNLSPVWDETATFPIPSRSRSTIVVEVYDWDRAGSNDLLGKAVLDSTSLGLQSQPVILALDTKGVITLDALFTPKYIRQVVEFSEGGLTGNAFKLAESGLGMATGAAGMGINVASGAAGLGINAASGAAGMGINAASGAVGGLTKGGSKLFGSIRGKESKNSTNNNRVSQLRENVPRAAPEARNSLTLDRSVPDQSYADTSMDESMSKKDHAPSFDGSLAHGNARSLSGVSLAQGTIAHGVHKGKVEIIGAEGIGKQALINVSLAQDGRLKHLHKTDNKKVNDKGAIRYGDTILFKATPDSNLVFGGVAHHTFGKDTELGTAQISLSQAVQINGQNVRVKMGSGYLIVKLEYATDVPPLPKMPDTN